MGIKTKQILTIITYSLFHETNGFYNLNFNHFRSWTDLDIIPTDTRTKYSLTTNFQSLENKLEKIVSVNLTCSFFLVCIKQKMKITCRTQPASLSKRCDRCVYIHILTAAFNRFISRSPVVRVHWFIREQPPRRAQKSALSSDTLHLPSFPVFHDRPYNANVPLIQRTTPRS